MPRARNIKPAFFSNEELVELPMSTRLLFIGLWTLADREGRLQDRPKRIKMNIFPADDVDVDRALGELHESGFIIRYESEGCEYIQILNFSKHQNPHKNEAASVIPKPGKTKPCTVQAPEQHRAAHADSLIPDSLNKENPPLGDKRKADPAEKPEPRGKRLPDDWTLPDDWRAWAKHSTPDIDIDVEAAKFADHFHASSTQNARKRDWLATWRNWCRRAQQYAPAPGVKAANGTDHKPRYPAFSDEQGWLALGTKLGVHANAGESWDSFRARIRNRMETHR